MHFLLRDYRPTPIIAPWNGGSGFYFREGKEKEKDPETGKLKKTGVRDEATEATRALEAIERSETIRLAPYRAVIRIARERSEGRRAGNKCASKCKDRWGP